ncbi:MAG: iron-containing alcohol dehydrogenase [Spirochaetota bacterium]|jgi:alcohol dehydrogenase class IV|nr:iron-containing alcohol dehydrogenase [Spirochaetota bacterium]
MSVFELNIPSRTIVGLNVVNRLPEIIQDFGERVMIVTSDVMSENGAARRIQSLAQSKAHGVIMFDDIKPESGSDTVDEGVLLARESRTNVIIGFGGMNTINIAKAIAFIAGNDGYIADYFAGRTAKRKKIAYIEIPSTHGICYGLIDSFFVRDVDENVRKEYRSRFNFADVVLVDPRFTSTLAPKFVVAIGLEVISHACEAYLSKAASILTESYIGNAIELIYPNLKQAILDPENMITRQSLATGAIFTSIALNSSRPGTAFALAMSLATSLGLYRGLASGLLLPHVMEFNLTASPNKYVRIARSCGEDVHDISVVEAAIKAVEAVRKLLFDLNVPQRLKSFEMEPEKFDDVVRDARTFDFLSVLPRSVTYDDLLNILNAAY